MAIRKQFDKNDKMNTSELRRKFEAANIAEQQASLEEMKKMMTSNTHESRVDETTQVNEKEKKSKAQTKPQQIKERRKMQISTHYTNEEKQSIIKLKSDMIIRGIEDATAEEIVHTAVLEFLNSGKSPETSKYWNIGLEQ